MSMNQASIEAHGKNFSLQFLKDSQQITKEVVRTVSTKVQPGMKESEAYKLLAEEFRSRGVRKFWHPIHVRFGSNTLFGYKEKSAKDIVLKENDIFFFDVGPVFNAHEGDFGETFVVGGDPFHHKASCDVKEIFEIIKELWKEKSLTGECLWKECERLANEKGWLLSPGYVRGHRISSFPHRLLTEARMSELNWTPRANVWVLEVQIRHPKEDFGAFYEDILS